MIGNRADDLLPLGFSLAMAARSSDLPGVGTSLCWRAIIPVRLRALRPKYLLRGYVQSAGGFGEAVGGDDFGEDCQDVEIMFHDSIIAKILCQSAH